MAAKKKEKAAVASSERKEAEAAEGNKRTTAAAASESGMVTVAYNSARGMRFTLGARHIHINGNAWHLAGKEKGVIPVGRFGYTRIPAEDWAAILKTYGSMEVFKNGLMFAEKSEARAGDKAAELAETRHGLEPVDIEKTATQETAPE